MPLCKCKFDGKKWNSNRNLNKELTASIWGNKIGKTYLWKVLYRFGVNVLARFVNI